MTPEMKKNLETAATDLQEARKKVVSATKTVEYAHSQLAEARIEEDKASSRFYTFTNLLVEQPAS